MISFQPQLYYSGFQHSFYTACEPKEGEFEPISLFPSFSLARGPKGMWMNLKEKALFEAVAAFEPIGFTSTHARVLLSLKETPQSVREVAQQSHLFQYEVRSVVQDLLGLDLIEYTRNGIQVKSEWEMLHRLAELCDDCHQKKAVEFEAAFEVAHPRVMALQKHWDF